MDFFRLFDIIPYQQQRFPQKKALAMRKGKDWRVWNTEEIIKDINKISTGLLKNDLQSGDCVAIFTNGGSPLWNIADMAMMQIGIIPVPIHATARVSEIAHILQDANVKGCFVQSDELLTKLQSAKGSNQLLVFSFDNLPNTITWEVLCTEPDTSALQMMTDCKSRIKEEDLATILYTSGTTGIPKGVMLSHRNIVSNIKAVMAIAPIDSDTVTVSFLPLSHIFERMVTYSYMAVGCQIWYADTVENLPSVLQEVKPHFFTAVPRIIEKMYERLLEHRDKQGFLGKKVFDWAMALGERYPFAGAQNMPFDYRLKIIIARWVVFNRFKKAMGGRIEGIAVGAAALQARLGRLISAAGVDIREGYGLTESSPVVAFNRFDPGGVHFGTVGIPVPGVEVRIMPLEDEDIANGDGEIQVFGPNLMLGYLNLPEETAQKFTNDGWLKTGDIGRFEYKRFLKITGRKSEIFKTTQGKFVAPQFVEQQMLYSPFIAQCIVLGLNRPYVSALIVPNFTHLENWCQENKVHWTAPQFMLLNPKIEKLFNFEIERINTEYLGNVEKIKTYKLLHEPWTSDNGLLTPTLKLKRESIGLSFKEDIEGLFKDS
jgi:long-chain acyl-CoA synthetase